MVPEHRKQIVNHATSERSVVLCRAFLSAISGCRTAWRRIPSLPWPWSRDWFHIRFWWRAFLWWSADTPRRDKRGSPWSPNVFRRRELAQSQSEVGRRPLRSHRRSVAMVYPFKWPTGGVRCKKESEFRVSCASLINDDGKMLRRNSMNIQNIWVILKITWKSARKPTFSVSELVMAFTRVLSAIKHIGFRA